MKTPISEQNDQSNKAWWDRDTKTPNYSARIKRMYELIDKYVGDHGTSGPINQINEFFIDYLSRAEENEAPAAEIINKSHDILALICFLNNLGETWRILEIEALQIELEAKQSD